MSDDVKAASGMDDFAGMHGPSAPATGRPDAPLARLEVLDRDGRVRHALAVQRWPVSIGRAIDNQLVLDDPFAAAHHAVVESGADGALQLRVLPGRNGVRCGRRLLAAGGEPVALDGLVAGPGSGPAAGEGPAPIELLVGQTRLRLRRAGDAIEPERLLAPATGGHVVTLGLALLLWLWILGQQAVSLDPGSNASDWLPPLIGAPLAVTAWCLVWGLASKIFQHRFEFWPHLAAVVRGLLVIELVTFALQWLSGLSGWVGFVRASTASAAAVGMVTLWTQARLVLPQQRRALGLAAAAAYVAGAAILVSLNVQRQERWFAELYVSALPPPALNWKPAVAREAFVKRAERLRPALDKSVAEAAAEQKERGDDSDEE